MSQILLKFDEVTSFYFLLSPQHVHPNSNHISLQITRTTFQ